MGARADWGWSLWGCFPWEASSGALLPPHLIKMHSVLRYMSTWPFLMLKKSGCRWKLDVRHYLYNCRKPSACCGTTTSQQDLVTIARPFFLITEMLSVTKYVFVSTQRTVLKRLQGTWLQLIINKQPKSHSLLRRHQFSWTLSLCLSLCPSNWLQWHLLLGD